MSAFSYSRKTSGMTAGNRLSSSSLTTGEQMVFPSQIGIFEIFDKFSQIYLKIK